jgi:hypothetical protein
LSREFYLRLLLRATESSWIFTFMVDH